MLEEKVALIEDQVVNIDILFDVKVFHVKRALVSQIGPPMSYISSRFLSPLLGFFNKDVSLFDISYFHALFLACQN